MDKCPFCGADTRPGDNFCLNCGNRLLATTPSPSSPSQAQPSMGEATIAASENWGGMSGSDMGTLAAGPSWGMPDENAHTVFASPEPSSFRTESAAPSSPDHIEQPARFVLRSDSGEVLQEYPLDKLEITIGRAPNSDILLSKDKLTSRRHATVHYENGQYVLRDERSANGTFVNGQQIEDMAPHVLRENDHVGIGEHELLFRSFNSQSSPDDVADMATVNITRSPDGDFTWRTHPDELATVATSNDDYGTHSIEPEEKPAEPAISAPEPAPIAAVEPPPAPVAPPTPVAAQSVPVMPSFMSAPSYPPITPIAPTPTPEKSTPRASEAPASEYMPPSSYNNNNDAGITFNRLTSLPQPTLPDIGALVAALSALDGQVTALQDQLNASQEQMRNHEAEVAQTANQLRAGVRRVSERMDNTIADVARSREALAWSELLQLMEDVMSNPRDIEYVTKLARKARELNKVFQLHQNVLSTMAECNSLLRSLIGERPGQG